MRLFALHPSSLGDQPFAVLSFKFALGVLFVHCVGVEQTFLFINPPLCLFPLPLPSHAEPSRGPPSRWPLQTLPPRNTLT